MNIHKIQINYKIKIKHETFGKFTQRKHLLLLNENEKKKCLGKVPYFMAITIILI
jgi:hypothetical protein